MYPLIKDFTNQISVLMILVKKQILIVRSVNYQNVSATYQTAEKSIAIQITTSRIYNNYRRMTHFQNLQNYEHDNLV